MARPKEDTAKVSSTDGMHLEVSQAGGERRIANIEAAGTLIGRSDDALVRLPDESVSRRHAEMFRDGRGRWWLRDLGSVNGTWIKGRSVAETVVNAGDQFDIGEYRLRLVDASDDGPETPRTAIAESTSLPLGDFRHARISTFSEVVSPKIDTTHLITINEFAHRLSHMQDASERLGELCRLMVRRVFHGSSAVALRLARGEDEDAPPEVLFAPQMRSGIEDPLPYISRSLLRVVRQSESPALAAHESTDPGAVKMTMVSAQEGLAAVACPLRRTDTTLDILYVTLPAAYGTGEWLTLIAHAAQTYEQIETALEAQRELEAKVQIERELDRASSIQRGLVPAEVTVDGLELAIGFEPCRWVAGDYVDVLPLGDGRTLLAIADVCGKGLPAALVSSKIHSVVHTCQGSSIGLPQMMTALNEHLLRFIEDNSFATMVSLVIDPASGAYELVNAGHPAPVVVAEDGTTSLMQCAANFPLGLMPYEVEVETGTLPSGHMLGLFTDGLTELTDDEGKELGVDRIVGHLRELYCVDPGAGAPLDGIANRLAALIAGYLGDRTPMDDRTFLLARRPTTA
jgi:serine phosphatase RsbU (regulator of sigma subunit)/pSer/pThr/pTyr-binding forkhead associated (FHA) protein